MREKLEAIEENAQIEIDRLNAQILDRDTKLEAAEAQRDGAIEQYLEYQKAWRAAESKLKEAQEESLQTVPDIDLLNEIGDVLEPYDYKGCYADAVRKLLAEHDELARLLEQK